MGLAHPTEPRQWVTLVHYAYNDRGELASAADALGQAATYRYSDKLLVQETFKNGLSFYFDYQGVGPQARCTRAGWQRLPGRGGLTSKLRAVADARGRFVRGGLTAGQRHDTPQALPLLAFGERLVTGIALIFNSFLDSLLSEEEAEDTYYAVHKLKCPVLVLLPPGLAANEYGAFSLVASGDRWC